LRRDKREGDKRGVIGGILTTSATHQNIEESLYGQTSTIIKGRKRKNRKECRDPLKECSKKMVVREI
jgi:hypothetical protein